MTTERVVGTVSLRDELVLSLEKALVGPSEGPGELINETPDRRYVSGILYPVGLNVGEAEDSNNEGESGDEDSANTSRLSMISERRPSSMGLSVITGKAAKVLHAQVDWATYERDGSDGDGRPLWRRKEWHQHLSLALPLGAGSTDYLLSSSAKRGPKPVITVTSRPQGDGSQVLSVFLCNRREAPEERELANLGSIFSPRVELTMDGDEFVARIVESRTAVEEDLASLRLLYRGLHEFATGHGCSVQWDTPDEHGCHKVWTTFTPQYRQPRLAYHPFGDNLLIGEFKEKKNLAATSKLLGEMIGEYEAWIALTFSKKGTSDADKLTGDIKRAFDRHKEECELAASRMRKGLEALRTDPRVQDAFLFMNHAMYLQRLHSPGAKRAPDPSNPLNIQEVRWHAFQMAFILATIPDIVNPSSEFRGSVDLLWVGTGGGKTEAYLGLAAFAMAYRRLVNGSTLQQSGGVSVLMRYTLRLLTIQQFQRASVLLCACENIRCSNPAVWGGASNPFLVGLFVGEDTTPNRIGSPSKGEGLDTEDWDRDNRGLTAVEALEQFRRKGTVPERSNPFQLTSCPWCGERLTPESYRIDPSDSLTGLRTHCANMKCFFHSHEIPALTVDEDILHRLPNLVIGTVDKFARLPFNPKFAALFGHVEGLCADHGFVGKTEQHATAGHRNGGRVHPIANPLHPPDLVIQDELHLLNGPLGSMVGAYETAIDFLSERKVENRVIRPKVVASTATIRRATEQVRAIFMKGVHRFPPPGTDIKHSFFVSQGPSGVKEKVYLGVMPSGIGQKTLLKKTLSRLLTRVQEEKTKGASLEVWDPYWTIITYFNSIRELGSARTTIEDDVNNEVSSVRNILPVPELTSNIDSSKLPLRLEELQRPGTAPDSIGVLACSNMFSVGVDVQRLGLMVVNSQPKSTSEYVQATGRVGRGPEGLVVVLFNWARPRDQSHFERFFDYHQRIQSHVEAMTVTPFSDGARRRGLHSAYIAMSRVKRAMDLSHNSDADNFTTSVRESPDCKAVEDDLMNRVAGVAPEERAEARSELDSFLDDWVRSSNRGKRLAYWNYRAKGTDWLVMVTSTEESEITGAGPRRLTPGSLRNVEEEVHISAK
ncbi:MAG: hypothetical protein JRN35_06895 [Nitrososphaerota archaeon]|nr:hypothetical protein [Nitrososphaerota archaeon]